MTDDFGVARGIDVQAFGQPGQRTFRLRIVGSKSESASLWMEKEHLGALSLAIRRVLSQVGYGREARMAEVDEFPEVADHDFRVGSIGIGFNPSNQTVVLELGELEKEEDSLLRVQLTLDHCASLIGQLGAIIVAGRPLCPLCSLPIDPSGHMCVRSNGESKQPIPNSGAADEDS